MIIVFLWFSGTVHAQTGKVVVEQSTEGWKLLVNGEAQIVNGMNWDYLPIGGTYTYNFWTKSPEFIQEALDHEMQLLKDIGVNAIRVYTGIPQNWITYIYQTYGIYTMLNHSFGRYGLSIDEEWRANTDFADPKVRELLLNEVKQLAEDYKNTPGLLLYLLGNENNYGLFWEGAETENIPVEDRRSTVRARAMYQLFNEAALVIKAIDPNHPVAICNGDLQFLDIIAEEVADADILGVNSYRGISFTDLFERVKQVYGKPVLLTEFGSDAFNALTKQEDEQVQADYVKGNWKEIYANAAGMEKAENVIGGFTFQFSDGWWKYDQSKNLDVHDEHASWSNGGYKFDYEEGKNNMNEEWFGVTAKGLPDSLGFYELYPRKAYFVLKKVHEFNPYTDSADVETLNDHFNEISVNTEE